MEKNRRSQGFSFGELLVVVVIIIIILFLSIPTLIQSGHELNFREFIKMNPPANESEIFIMQPLVTKELTDRRLMMEAHAKDYKNKWAILESAVLERPLPEEVSVPGTLRALDNYNAKVDKAEANVDSARAVLKNSERNYEKLKEVAEHYGFTTD